MDLFGFGRAFNVIIVLIGLAHLSISCIGVTN